MSLPCKNKAGTMTELIPGIFVISGITNVGVITDSKKSEIYLIDTGRTEEQGVQVLETLENHFGPLTSSSPDRKYTIKAIYNTHAHADHTGADAFFQLKTNCEIYLSAAERGILENPFMQSAVLWGGFPPKEFRNSLYTPTNILHTKLIDFSKTKSINAPDGKKYKMSFLELPGHYFGDTGILITSSNGEKVLFAGDAISNREELGKYWIQFMIQPDKCEQTLQKICSIENLKWCIPSHGKCITDDLNETAELCTIAIYSTRQAILNALKKQPLSTEELITQVAKQNNITMGFGQYHLVSTTIRSHLSALRENKQIKGKVIDNKLIWEACKNG